MIAAETKKVNTMGSNPDENVLGMYLKEINHIPLLTRDEEAQYAREAIQGNIAARNKLVNGNLRFVVNVAKKYQGQGIPLADLINEGNIGLINAVEKFDVERGYHFISYAVWWIRQSILKALYDKSRLIRLPVNRACDLVQIEKARKKLNSSSSGENEIHEIAQLLNVDDHYVSDIMTISREVVSLEKLIDADKSSSTLENVVVDNRYDAPDQAVLKQFLQHDIEKILTTLESKEAEVIRCRFGLGTRIPMSLQEIGEYFNLSKERIRQIEEKALLRLQHYSRKSKLEDYVA